MRLLRPASTGRCGPDRPPGELPAAFLPVFEAIVAACSPRSALNWLRNGTGAVRAGVGVARQDSPAWMSAASVSRRAARVWSVSSKVLATEVSAHARAVRSLTEQAIRSP